MKFYSEVLNQLFDSEKELNAAEMKKKELDNQRAIAQQKAEAERRAQAEVRKQRAAEIEEAKKVMDAAQEHYRELLEKFCKDYGSYHFTSSNWEDIPRIFNSFLIR